ncbi:MAG: aminotransferase class I/II-fold pyridoxal phosphate-dependent enzyme, partial [Candidatus Margulisiibacteriota bacterium]
MTSFTTKSLHTRSSKADAHQSLNFPIYESVAFEFSTAEELEKAFLGQKPAHMYSRITNPSVEYFEQKIKNVTDALGVIAVASGMAAISDLFLTIAAQGDNIVTTKYLFGNTYSLFQRTLKPWGLEVRFAELNDPASVAAQIDQRTRAIFLETITNPQLEVADLEKLAKIAKEKNILLVVDSTLTPPNIFQAAKFGVNIEVLSSTKFISGGATSVGGLIVDHGNYDWSKNPALAEGVAKYGPFTLLTKLRREAYRNLGSCLSPHNAYLQSLGLDTLCLRVGKACQNTLELAQYLKSKGLSVNYPGLADAPGRALVDKQFQGQ